MNDIDIMVELAKQYGIAVIQSKPSIGRLFYENENGELVELTLNCDLSAINTNISNNDISMV